MAAHETKKTTDTSERNNRFLLIVDSDAHNLYYLSMILQRLNYHISTATNAEEAITIASVATPSLVITALDLRGTSGLDLVRQLKQNQICAHVPIITLQKHSDPSAETQCRKLGVAECISPPILTEKLFQAVQSTIEISPRLHIRIKTLLPVKVNNIPLNGLGGPSAVVLSERGIFLPTMTPSPVDTRHTIQIKLGKQSITAEATVLHCNHSIGGPNQEPGMGLDFVRITPNDQDCIRQFIKDEITRGIVPLND